MSVLPAEVSALCTVDEDPGEDENGDEALPESSDLYVMLVSRTVRVAVAVLGQHSSYSAAAGPGQASANQRTCLRAVKDADEGQARHPPCRRRPPDINASAGPSSA